MSKLYAIRDKNTGNLLNYKAHSANDGEWVLRDKTGIVWADTKPSLTLKYASTQLPHAKLELVILRIEPTEPCEHCENPPEQYIVEEVAPRCPVIVVDRRSVPSNLCPNCGRSLT